MGNNKHLSMKSVFSSLCIFLALLATASASTKGILTQGVTFTGVTKASYTGDLKKMFEYGYAQANQITTGAGATLALKPGIELTSSASGTTDAAVTFIVPAAYTFIGTFLTPVNAASKAALATAYTTVKTGNAALYGAITAPTEANMNRAEAVASTPVPTAAPTTANSTNGTSSASGIGQFSRIALSIPVVAMVISKMV